MSAKTTHHRPPLARRLRDAKGQSLLETAIVVPMLLMVTFGIIEFGALFYVNLALESGVSQASRYSITGASMDGMSRPESIKAAMRRATPTLTLNDDVFSFSHLQGANWVQGVGGPGTVQKVTVTYNYRPFVLKPLFPSGQITLRVESTMKNEDRFN